MRAVSDDLSCAECSIALRQIATLASGPEASFAFLPPPSVARDSQARFYVGTMFGDFAVGVFSPEGVLDGVIGPIGRGPGEFVGYPNPMLIRAAPAGGVRVFHASSQYVIGPSGKVEAQYRLRLNASDAIVMGQETLVQATVHAPSGGTPIQRLASDGSVVEGMGVDRRRPLLRSSSVFERVRRLAATRDGLGVWAAYINRYELIRFDLGGEVEARVQRESEWFPPYSEEIPGELFIVPQRPRIEGIAEDDRGMLWVIISRGTRNMSPVANVGVEDMRAGAEVGVSRDININRYVDTVIEVMDPSRGVVVAREIFERTHLRLVSDAQPGIHLFRVTERESGELDMEILAAVLER